MAEASHSDLDVYPIPSSYELLDFVGSGDFGLVTKCRKRDTGETVAIKISRFVRTARQEVSILEELMRHNLNQSNIVKFYDWYQMNNSTGIVLEMLDMTLVDYMKEDRLPLKDIRLIIQQLATAFDGLKAVGIIYGDLKPDNIMLVKDAAQSYTVKLIDFGLAFHRSEAVVGSSHQLPYYRAPEIMLGLPFTEAIDMWSLGAVMGLMMFGNLIFPWFCDYSQMQSICEILGQPADHLLDAGLKTKEFFIKISDNHWRLKTHDQYWTHRISFGTKRVVFRSLDDLKTLSEELDAEATGWKQCIDLLKAMLKVDAGERIIPSQVLNHPFITQNFLDEVLQPAADEPSSSGGGGSSQALTDSRRTETVTEADDRSRSDPAQDTQGDTNTTSECLSDTLCVETLTLDPDPAADPGTAQDTNTTEEIQTLAAEPEATSADGESHEEKKKRRRRKKKKKVIRRFFSWMKQTFSCCVSEDIEDETS